jgi:HD superfamily phosphodiesterase
MDHAFVAALRHMVATGNFVHTASHVIRVVSNAWMIVELDGTLQLSSERRDALILACLWHDSGKIDRQAETECHARVGVRHLALHAAANPQLAQAAVEMASTAILNHRNRGYLGDPAHRPLLARILWDADKLDILNPSRMQQLDAHYNSEAGVGEFTREGSLRFWESISHDFLDRFHLSSSRELARARFEEFDRTRSRLRELWNRC